MPTCCVKFAERNLNFSLNFVYMFKCFVFPVDFCLISASKGQLTSGVTNDGGTQARLRGVNLFRFKNMLRPKKKKKKGLRRKISGFFVRSGLETKQIVKTRSSPQISGVMVSHHNVVSPQNVSFRAFAIFIIFGYVHCLVLYKMTL